MKLQIDHEKCCWKDSKCESCGCGEGKCYDVCVGACPVQAIERKDKVEIDLEILIVELVLLLVLRKRLVLMNSYYERY